MPKKPSPAGFKKFPLPPQQAKTFPLPAIIFFLGSIFLFRLAFGLATEIWFIDQQQIYLLGLKFFTTGQWPYFGPDVAANIQLPGALQGLVVGLPLFLLPIPEAPYIFLAILSFSSLSLLAWYISKRLPQFPPWIIWTWVLTAPWVMNWSTNIDNDSYALTGGILFFIGFIETIPALRRNLVPSTLANLMMGFGLLWTAQFHMSYVILFPFLIFSAFQQIKTAGPPFLKSLFFFTLGALASGIFIIPTLLKHGLSQGLGGSGNAIAFNPENFGSFFTILARFLCLASCEVPRFIGANSSERWAYLDENLKVAPFVVTAAILGFLQILTLFLSAFRLRHPQKDWAAVKLLTFLTFLLIYISFLFAIKTPAAHTYYITLPIVMIYAFYVFSPWTSNKKFLTAVKILLICNIVFHLGLAIHNLPVKSLYKDRGTFVKAIGEKNYHLLGERRPNTLY